MVKGAILLLYGVFVIGLADNILRPLLVGRDTKMPDWLILVSTLGGLTTFGISGFVIGPIVAAMFLAIWTMFGEAQEEGLAIAKKPLDGLPLLEVGRDELQQTERDFPASSSINSSLSEKAGEE